MRLVKKGEKIDDHPASATINKCSECGRDTDDIFVEMGEEPEYDSWTAYLCLSCIKKAGALIEKNNPLECGEMATNRCMIVAAKTREDVIRKWQEQGLANFFEKACREWLKGCSCAEKDSPEECEECTEAFLRHIKTLVD